MKTLRLLSILILSIFIFSGCSNSNKDQGDSNSGGGSANKPYVNPLTGESSDNSSISDKRPVAIMINNIKQALPQYGISSADIIYETLAEGGITRLMALYSDVDKIPKTGPIRSLRDYYIDFLAPYNAVLTHFGASPKGYDVIKRINLNNIDGMSLEDSCFIQDMELAKTRGREHSFFIDSSGILKGAKQKNYKFEGKVNSPLNFIKPKEGPFIPTSGVANKLSVEYSYSAKASFVYDQASTKYKKFQNNVEHMDANNNSQLEFDNIIIIKTNIKPIPNDSSGRVSVELKQGSGYYVSKGNKQDISWSKESLNSNFLFKDDSSNELKINVGKTFIAVLPNDGDITIE